MSEQSRWRGAAAALVSACVLMTSAGCAVTVQLTTPTGPVVPGTSVPFTLGLTNPSQCPVGGPIGLFLPFLPATAFQSSGNNVIDDIFLAILNAACTGQAVQFPEGVECTFVDQTLVCEVGPFLRTGGGGEVPLRAGDQTFATCNDDGSKITCKMAPVLADASFVLPDPLTCVGLSGDIALCGADELDPGASATTSFNLFAPIAPGTYRSLWIGFAQETGVCKGGSEAGTPCDVNADCAGMGATCAPGICVNTMTQATAGGCTLDVECAGGETCVRCQPDLPPNAINIPLACAQITIGQTAPAQSPWGMVGSAAALLALGFFGLRRMRRG